MLRRFVLSLLILAISAIQMSAAGQTSAISEGRKLNAEARSLYDNGNKAAARLKYEQACQENFHRACYSAGVMYNLGQGGTLDRTKAFNLVQKGCFSGDPESCVELGAFYSEGVVIPGDPALAAKYFKTGCDENFVLACHNLAILYGQGRGVKRDLTTSFIYTDKACYLGRKSSCDIRNKMMDSGRLDYGWEDSELHRKMCDLNFGRGCYNLAQSYKSGLNGFPKNILKALEYWDQSCDMGIKNGCVNAGIRYRTGEGIGYKNLSKAASHFAKACQLDDAVGCYFIAKHHREGSSVEQNDAMAVSYFEKSCELGDPDSCVELVGIYNSGKLGVLENQDTAEMYVEKACALGHELACETKANLSEISREFAEKRAEKARRRAEQRRAEIAADNERRRQAAVRGAYANQSTQENRVCAMIYQGGRANYQCMSESHYNRYYRP